MRVSKFACSKQGDTRVGVPLSVCNSSAGDFILNLIDISDELICIIRFYLASALRADRILQRIQRITGSNIVVLIHIRQRVQCRVQFGIEAVAGAVGEIEIDDEINDFCDHFLRAERK